MIYSYSTPSQWYATPKNLCDTPPQPATILAISTNVLPSLLHLVIIIYCSLTEFLLKIIFKKESFPSTPPPHQIAKLLFWTHRISFYPWLLTVQVHFIPSKSLAPPLSVMLSTDWFCHSKLRWILARFYFYSIYLFFTKIQGTGYSHFDLCLGALLSSSLFPGISKVKNKLPRKWTPVLWPCRYSPGWLGCLPRGIIFFT